MSTMQRYNLYIAQAKKRKIEKDLPKKDNNGTGKLVTTTK